MERLSALITDPPAILLTLKENGHHVLELIKSHPWTSLGVFIGTVLVWSYIRAPRNLPPENMASDRTVTVSLVSIAVMMAAILIITSITLYECKQDPGDAVTSSRFSLEDLEAASAEYFDIQDRVLKYRQLSHHWDPNITKIEKVTNGKLTHEYLKAMMLLFGPNYSSLKFHGTSTDALNIIVKDGFILPKKAGYYGAGVYFATDASKSAKHTKHSNKLLLCDVLLGRSLTLQTADNLMTGERLVQERCDSVYAKRDTRLTGGVLYDEFVIFRPAQAVPKYIIHYRL